MEGAVGQDCVWWTSAASATAAAVASAAAAGATAGAGAGGAEAGTDIATGTSASFLDAVSLAIERNVPLRLLAGDVIQIDSSILIKANSAQLTIIGERSSGDKAKIVGTGHSIFQIGGRNTKLILINLDLCHCCARDDHKDVGANVFALNLANVELSNCGLLSSHGFCLWSVQRSYIKATDCYVRSERRSGCVAFGRSKLEIRESVVSQCGIHGICSRGNTKILMDKCRLEGCEKRAVYAYHSVDLKMTDCRITGTRLSTHAAIDIFSSTPSGINNLVPIPTKQSPCNQHPQRYTSGQGYKKHVVSDLKLSLLRCEISNNSGIGLRIQDDATCLVEYHIDDCIIKDNEVGDTVFKSNAVAEDEHNETEFERPTLDHDSTAVIGTWKYEVDDPGKDDKGPLWMPYDADTCQYLETCFHAFHATRSSGTELKRYFLPPPLDQYEIDFSGMIQTNINTFYCRSISRAVS
jgi:hypothetical protein